MVFWPKTWIKVSLISMQATCLAQPIPDATPPKTMGNSAGYELNRDVILKLSNWYDQYINYPPLRSPENCLFWLQILNYFSDL